MPKISRLAKEFAAELTMSISNADRNLVAKAQAAEVNPFICHLHDVRDANMVMFAAFCTVFGREPDLQSDDDLAAINAAWVPGRELFLRGV